MRFFLTLLLFACVGTGMAQVTQVNPNIKWRFVRSQTLDLAENRIYQFEVPAEKGFDYMLNLDHDLNGVVAQMYVYDLQYKSIASFTDSSSVVSSDLHFRVPDNGTYIVVLRIVADEQKDAVLPTTVSLVRRVSIN